MEKILAENLAALMAAHKDLDSQPKVAAATRGAIDQTTVGRVLKGQHSVQISTVEALAKAFDVEPYQLLIPGLNAKNPQVLRAISEKEERFYKLLADTMKGNGTQ